MSSYLFLFTSRVHSIPETIGRRMIKMVNKEYNKGGTSVPDLKRCAGAEFISLSVYTYIIFLTGLYSAKWNNT